MLVYLRSTKQNQRIPSFLNAYYVHIWSIISVLVCTSFPFFPELFQCGSMSEGTRIWKSGPRDSQAILEYDILSVLRCLNEETVRVNRSCVSFMEAIDSDKILPKKFT